MPAYKEIDRCRICGNGHLRSVFHLGDQALTGVFPRSRDEDVVKGPVELIKCDESVHTTPGMAGGCGLVQLRQSYDPAQMYGENYGYRSGLNQSMVRHLQHRVAKAMSIAKPAAGDVVLDVGSNDCTSLKSYPNIGLTLIGMDPSGDKFRKYYPPHVKLVADFFGAANFEKALPGKKAKIVTSLAMFYDLESPTEFMAQVEQILDDDGIWVFEQSYCPEMVVQNAYDTICHEHLEYYCLKQIKWMADRVGLKIIDVEMNDVNGGSFCLTVAKRDSSKYREATDLLSRILDDEMAGGYGTMHPYEEFASRISKHRDELVAVVADHKKRGKSVYGYGASTKGNVLLQYCNFTDKDIPAIAEVNEEKFGRFTPGTRIPIKSEADVKAEKPDCLLVLPWHFRQGIVQREQAYLAAGGTLAFPLPKIEIVSLEVSVMKEVSPRPGSAARRPMALD